MSEEVRGTDNTARRRGTRGIPGWLLYPAIVALALAPTVWVVVTWLSPGDGRITRWRDLQKLPEATLYYPGSTVLGSGGYDFDKGLLGINDATYNQQLGADASNEEVVAFYARELPARGWATDERSGGRSTDELLGRAWRKGQLIFRLGLPRPGTQANREPGYHTVYAITLIVHPLSSNQAR